jgi:hypothetical protein
MNEAMTKANFDRSEQRLPPLKEVKLVRPEPSKPNEDDELLARDARAGYSVKLEYAYRKNLRNDEGILFVGYDVSFDLLSEKEDTITLKGWMVEGEFMQFVRNHRKEIDQQVINW